MHPSGPLNVLTGSDTRSQELDAEKTLGRNVTLVSPNDTKNNEMSKEVTAQDWTGDDDPENPMNWPLLKRIYGTSIAGFLAFIVTFGSSVYTAGSPDVEKYFGVSQTAAILPLSLYTLGLAFGPMLAAPLSETYGRKGVYLYTLPVSLFCTLGAGFSKNFGSLLVCRFLAGSFGSPVLAMAGATTVEIWRPIQRAAAMALFLLASFLGPAAGPVIGGFASEKGWQWTQWPILFIGLATWLYCLFQCETYKRTILSTRAKRLGVPPPERVGPQGLWPTLKFLVLVTIARPVIMLLTEPIVGFYSLYTAFNFAVLFAFFAAFPYTFESVYQFDRGHTGLVFLGIGTGCFLAVALFITIDRLTYRKRTQQARAAGFEGPIAPEYRLYPAMAGSVLLPMGLFCFAWTAKPSVHFMVPIVATVPFACGNLMIFGSAALYLVDTYGPMSGASALAGNNLLRYTLGAVFPLFTLQMYRTMGIDWATSLLGFIAVCLMPIPWILFKFGKGIRAKSGYDTIKFIGE